MEGRYTKLFFYATVIFAISYTGAKYFVSKTSTNYFDKGIKAHNENDIEKSLKFFKSACFGRKELGCFNAGILSFKLKEYNTSYDYFIRGCGFKNAQSCYKAGDVLINFIKPSNKIRAQKTAKRLFKLGCDLGDNRACEMLNKIKLDVKENPN